MTADASCVLCGGERFEDAVVGYDRVVPRREDFRYRRCLGCSLVALTPLPRDADLAGLYPDDYAPHAASGRIAPGPRNAFERFAARHRYAARQPRPVGLWEGLARVVARPMLRGVFDPRGADRMLDVGCGSGALLARHRALGWEVQGVEPSERAVAACRSRDLPVEHGGLLDVSLPGRHFDVIALHHVIEHVPSPVDVLRRARSLLAPGGLVEVLTPNVASLGFRLYGSCWYALDAPRHLHLFDARCLARLAERAGLVVARVSSRPSARVLAASRHYARTQGPLLPPGHASRAAVLARSREEEPSRGFRRAVRPAAQVLAWLGLGETLRAELVDPGRARSR